MDSRRPQYIIAVLYAWPIGTGNYFPRMENIGPGVLGRNAWKLISEDTYTRVVFVLPLQGLPWTGVSIGVFP